MRDGLYESVITDALKAQIEASADLESRITVVDTADEVHVLTLHLAEALARRLDDVKNPVERLKLANEVLRVLESAGGPSPQPASQRGTPRRRRPVRAVRKPRTAQLKGGGYVRLSEDADGWPYTGYLSQPVHVLKWGGMAPGHLPTRAEAEAGAKKLVRRRPRLRRRG